MQAASEVPGLALGAIKTERMGEISFQLLGEGVGSSTSPETFKARSSKMNASVNKVVKSQGTVNTNNMVCCFRIKSYQ